MDKQTDGQMDEPTRQTCMTHNATYQMTDQSVQASTLSATSTSYNNSSVLSTAEQNTYTK